MGVTGMEWERSEWSCSVVGVTGMEWEGSE